MAGYDSEEERMETAERVRAIRNKKKSVGNDDSASKCSRTCKDQGCMLHPERDRKRKYRAALEDVSTESSSDGRSQEVIKRRRGHNDAKNAEIRMLQINVKKLTNEKRRLKRKEMKLAMAIRMEEDEDEEPEDKEAEDEEAEDEDAVPVDCRQRSASSSLSSSILDVVSPLSRKKVYRRLSQQPEFPAVKKQLRKEGRRINLRDSLEERNEESVTRQELSHAVVNFMNEEGNSSECPDKDKTHLRYRLDFLSVLHQKFVAESNHECSFAQFCRLIPENIVKPKPTDWGTNLCMTCINPQLMLEGLKRATRERDVQWAQARRHL